MRMWAFTLIGAEDFDFDDTINGDAGGNSLKGGDGKDSLSGMDGNDMLDGGNGGDTLRGGLGSDVLIGGAGGDAIDGGHGIDTASYNGSSVGVSVNLQTGMASGGHAKDDVLIGIENLAGGSGSDTLTGGVGANTLMGADGEDVIHGGDGNDSLDGGDGNDTLAGGAGADTLTGGAGADLFQFAAFEGDRIDDFEDGIDMIDPTGATDISGIMITDAGSDASISWNGGTLTLIGIDHTAIDAGRFHLLSRRSSGCCCDGPAMPMAIWLSTARCASPRPATASCRSFRSKFHGRQSASPIARQSR